MLHIRRSVVGFYTACGVAFGCVFPAVALPIDAYMQTGSLGPRAVAEVWPDSPLLWMIASAPLFLGIFARKAGVRQDKIAALLAERDETIDQQTAELRTALDAANAADAAKSAFLASMSHEIRTPMNAVIGVAELLRGTDLTPDQLSFVSTIQTSGESLLVIINDILDFSKIEAGELELENRPYDLSDCVSSALELLAVAAADKGLELAYIEDPAITRLLYGDRLRMRQIVLNLVGNAIKFTNEGEVVISVHSESIDRHGQLVASGDGTHDSEGRRVTVRVRDTGIGIARDQIDELFKSFSQVDASTTRKFAGTGLGLAISRQLVEMMGGDISVSSRGLGHGSTFSFTIDAKVHSSKSAAAEILADRSIAGMRVLVVDDNATNREILIAQTSQWGMHPAAFDAAGPALRAVEQGTPFDIAVLDMHMPDVDGLTLACRLRDHFASAGHSFPLLLLSSGNVSSDTKLRTVFDEVLLKPARGERLHAVLSELAATATPSQPEATQARPTTVVGAADADPTAGSVPTDESPGDGKADRASDGLRILLVEDNLVNQKVALAMLRRLGYRAEVANDGQSARDIIEAERFDVVMMDVQMPVLDGMQATRQIRAEVAAENQPHIIAMTANAMSRDRQACIDAGMDDYIAKPVRLDDLAGALARLSIDARR